MPANLKTCVWKKEDEAFGGLSLDARYYADASELHAGVTMARRKFYNYIEEDELVKTNSKLAKETLIKEYKGIRFYDAEEGDKGEHYRIRSDRFDWTAGRGWGWSVSCDKMPNKNA